MAASDWVIGFSKVIGSALEGEMVTVQLAGIGSLDPSVELDDGGEKDNNADVFGVLGLVFRPKDADADGYAESMDIKQPDGKQPFAWRDVRLHRVFPNPKKGSVSLIGYEGAFVSLEPTTGNVGSKKGNIVTAYVPYAFVGDVATKAMTVVIDPENEHISLIHGEGYAVVISEDQGVVQRDKSGASWTQLKDEIFTVVAQQIQLRGIVMTGPGPVWASALSSSAFQGSTSLVITTP